jgi:hypothetical protein
MQCKKPQRRIMLCGSAALSRGKKGSLPFRFSKKTCPLQAFHIDIH